MAARTCGIIHSFAVRSLDPPRALWSLSMASSSRPVFEQAAHFLVYALAKAHERVAPHFADRESIVLQHFNSEPAEKAFRYCRASLYNLSAVSFAGTGAVTPSPL